MAGNKYYGALFKNSYKQKDSHPDYCGDLTIGGIKYELAGWKKQTKDNQVYLSLSAKPSENTNQNQTAQSQVSDPFDDDIPF